MNPRPDISQPQMRMPGDNPERDQQLRILSLAPTSFFGDYGCHVRILEEARALQAQGHEVTILTYFKGKDVPGLRIIRTAPTPWRAHYEVGSSRHKFVFDILLSIRLLRVLSRNRFDLIHAHLHEGALIGSLLSKPWRIPVCFDYQGSLTDEMIQHGFMRANNPPVFRFWRGVENLANRLPDAIFTSTIQATEVLRSELGAHKLIYPLLDGVNTDVFHPDVLTPAERNALRARWGIAPTDTAVVFLGLLARHQGIDIILEAAARVKAQGKAVRWLVMGYPGVEQWRFAAAARGVSQEVIFTGRVAYSDAPRMLALGDIAIAPKLSLTEGSGKVLNYMAMGLPTVAFDTPGQTQYLGNLGLYASVGDREQLANHIISLLDQPERRRELGRLLRARAEQFSWRKAGQLLAGYYQQVLGHPHRHTSHQHIARSTEAVHNTQYEHDHI
ncbi:MAG: glycosyltransferase family 4 protein [Anaerolineae bacterium]|nr:glycosyltransferase family 4 protein [Thermoflexales bacterium]MDW8406985.1 glycosyltransferase family 4 protein [Anaerolineae bacterium]